MANISNETKKVSLNWKRKINRYCCDILYDFMLNIFFSKLSIYFLFHIFGLGRNVMNENRFNDNCDKDHNTSYDIDCSEKDSDTDVNDNRYNNNNIEINDDDNNSNDDDINIDKSDNNDTDNKR